ncbi:MAG: hypothetical protein ACRD0K_21655 [Egibacteraceae bacterium]
MDIDQVRIRTRELAEATAAAVAPEVEAVPVSINDLESCTGEGLTLQAIHDLELRWDREGFNRVALRDRTERYFRQQGYDVEIENPDSEIIDVIAYTNIFKIIVRVAILGHKDEVAVFGTSPCIEVDADTFEKKYLP